MSEFINKAKDFVAEKVAHIPKPEASLADVDLKHVSSDSIIFNCEVSVTNPYDFPIPICEISYTIKSATANRVIGSGKMEDPGSLAGKQTTKLDATVKVPYSIIVDLVWDIGSDWDIDYEIEVGLTVDLPILGNFTLPFSKKGELKLPTVCDLFY